MKITARVDKILDLQSGTAKSGDVWKKQGVIVHQFNKFKDDLLIDMWNDGIIKVEEGKTYDFEVTIKSREYNGKYYTNINCNSLSSANKDEENPFE